MMNEDDRIEPTRFPTMNVYLNPRIINQKVDNKKIPLLKYQKQVTASNRSNNFESNFVDPKLLRKFQQKDGLIYGLKNMKKPVESFIKKQVDYFENGKATNQKIFQGEMQDLNRKMKTSPTDPQLKRLLNENGSIKILICVCMYNESKNAINLTLNGIYKNLKKLREKQGVSNGDIAVVLMQDGILKLVQDRKTRTFAKGENSMVKFYEKIDQNQGKDRCELIQRINTILDEVENYERFNMLGNVQRNRDIPPSIQKNISLVYQNMWKPSKTFFPDGEKRCEEDTQDELKIFSCFKHTNGTKLSSHLWFFQGFCRFFKPQFCVLLDVGTVPDENGIVNLIKGLEQDKHYGGATGFMSVDSNFPSQEGGDGEQEKSNCLVDCLFSIQKAQEYQYIISHFLDKNTESALGFLHVLPGAWSAYRYNALIKSEEYQKNLLEESYFKMILNPDLEQQDFREANMYLAEDRILSLGIYTQKNCCYTLKYVPNAIAYTDPMKDHENLMNQRRRWINSSFFAFFYVFDHYYFHVVESRHNFYRKFISLNLSMILALLSMLNSYITPSIYFFVMYSAIYQLGFQNSDIVAQIVTGIYTMIFLVAVAGALTGRQWSKRAHMISVVFSLFTFLMLAVVIYIVILIYLGITDNPAAQGRLSEPFDINQLTTKQTITLVMIALNLGNFLLLMMAHLITHPQFVWKLFKNTISYMYYTGAYAQTMVIHGFCNVDDVSWGTKGSAGQGGKKYQSDKVFFVSSWLFINALLAFIFLYVDVIMIENGQNNTGGLVLIIISIYATAIITLKTVLALIYHFVELFRKCCYRRISSELRAYAIDNHWKKLFNDWKAFNSQAASNNLSNIVRKNK